ncbi:MAG: hypothetical protein Kow0099_32410 [Candidatus Abyssubacteria bacterium]
MTERVQVLVVDDEEVVLQSVLKVLKSDHEHEFLVDTATSAPDGLQLMEHKKFDIIITDLMMPGIDGLQFIDRIRQVDRDSRIIMITGYATMRTALQALRKGAFDYIAKPFTKEELRTVVKNAARVPALAGDSGQTGATGTSLSGEYRSFFHQTYARMHPDGTMYLGIEPAFLNTIGEPLSIEVSKPGESVSQGFPFASLTNSAMRVFNLRAPFSGRVLQVNGDAIGNMDLIRKDPYGAGWLVQITPTDFENEVENLGP